MLSRLNVQIITLVFVLVALAVLIAPTFDILLTVQEVDAAPRLSKGCPILTPAIDASEGRCLKG